MSAGDAMDSFECRRLNRSTGNAGAEQSTTSERISRNEPIVDVTGKTWLIGRSRGRMFIRRCAQLRSDRNQTTLSR